jgi:hypothetical protein
MFISMLRRTHYWVPILSQIKPVYPLPPDISKPIKIYTFYSGGCEEDYVLGCKVVESVESRPTFGRNMSPPSSGFKMEATDSSETPFRYFDLSPYPNKSSLYSVERCDCERLIYILSRVK